MQSKKILINKLETSSLNPNEMSPDHYNKLREHIKQAGKYPSLIVMAIGKRYVLLDGHNRLQILKELSHEEVWCEIWDVDKKRGKVILATINRLRGIDDTQKRAKLISELYSDFKEDKDLLLRLLPESERVFNTLLKMVDDEMDKTIEDLETERGIVEEKLANVVNPEEAKEMANLYKRVDEGKMRITFIFEDEIEYAISLKYFGIKKPDVKKLMELVYEKRRQSENNERKQKKKETDIKEGTVEV